MIAVSVAFGLLLAAAVHPLIGIVPIAIGIGAAAGVKEFNSRSLRNGYKR